MDKIVNAWIEEIENRCRNQSIDTEGCFIMFQRNKTYFNGEVISGFSESKDGRWMCIPVYDEELSDMADGYVYSPQCFEIKDKMTTFLSNGVMKTLTTIWLLRKHQICN